MKNLLLTMTAMLVAAVGFSQAAKVPKAAMNDFKTRFPNAKDVRWEGGKGGYEAEWKDNGREASVVYDQAGKYLMTERHMEPAGLPKVVAAAVLRDFPGAVVMEAEHMSMADGREAYELEFKHQGKSRERIYGPDGRQVVTDSDGDGNPDSDDDDEEDDDDEDED